MQFVSQAEAADMHVTVAALIPVDLEMAFETGYLGVALWLSTKLPTPSSLAFY